MAKIAILLYEETPEKEQVLLARTLDFFGVPWKMLAVSTLLETDSVAPDNVVFGSVPAVARVLGEREVSAQRICSPAAFYVYAGTNRAATEVGLRSLLKNRSVSLREPFEASATACASAGLAEWLGPMAGIEAHIQFRKDDAFLVGLEGAEHKVETIISVEGSPVYVRFSEASIPIYLCASSYVIDIDEEIRAGFYDVKSHFCSVIPLVSFIKFMFREEAWHPQELGACLIIDDPLLKERYGGCNFLLLRDLMHQYGFTTNIAFIPWNWWRTSRTAQELFGNGSGPFSISIHGCDHIKSEFGDSSPVIIGNRAKLAQVRMRQHRARTGIHHDPIMVFPQGVFSSGCPAILKRNGFVAAVNTEISPADGGAGCTRIRDVWDIAITKYGDFAIFTRRYAHHGLENFAFDLLLGKPCLIVAHHDFFKDDCATLIQLIEGLHARNYSLNWGPLGRVIRKACRRRTNDVGAEEIEMYGNELIVLNSENREIRFTIRKQQTEADAVTNVECEQTPIPWRLEKSHCCFESAIPSASDRHFRIFYRAFPNLSPIAQSITFRSMVATRRLLSEFRDSYFG